eukprot:gene9586-11354_t
MWAGWQRKSVTAAKIAKRIKLELLPSERSAVICMSPATTTVTFFRGSRAVAEAHFAKRVAEIVAANPWLTSVLERDPDSGLMNAYHHSSAADAAAKTKCHFQVLTDVDLSRLETSYAAMVTRLGSALCLTSDEAVGTGAPLWKVSLVPDAKESSRFALVVSANHSLVDGHGFYKIYNMLSGDASTRVEALSAVRKQEMGSKILEAMGNEPSLMAAAPAGFLARFIGGQVWSALFPTTKSYGFHLSEDWVAERKKLAAKQKIVPYVSTNDCMVSEFLNCLQCDVAIMAVNFRGKVNGCGESDVGNYEDLLSYTPADYKTAAMIRKSVSGKDGVYSRAAKPRTTMLTNWEHLTKATYAAVTNWATFAKPLIVKDAEQELHLPLYDFPKSTPACVFGSMVIFRPGSGHGVAAFVAGKQELIDAVKGSGMVGRQLEICM